MVKDECKEHFLDQWVNFVSPHDVAEKLDNRTMGCIRFEPHKIVLSSELPMTLRPYRTSPQDSKEIETQVEIF
ncbi:hypothetical protein NPIL_363611 [Nephila pilipes]|uniref:Uncharacterized protein n=1 Tax=Nephila pilipes TaxID=299642 RepID=A0A8X6MS00_NEPPI|nr:hypothetical protein NPIL_363611 [Nephila pilipes]